LTPSFFYVIINIILNTVDVNKERLKLILKNMELLLESLKKELLEEDAVEEFDEFFDKLSDYDEVFVDGD